MEIFDISRTLSAELPPWPGDVPFQYRLNGRIAEGSSVNVGAIDMSLHNGTHADAMFHFEDDGWTMEQAELLTYFGPAVVIDLASKYAGDGMPQITIQDLSPIADELPKSPRLLLKTNVWSDSHTFPKQIPVIAPDVTAWLQARGLKLLGFDVPSVDEITSKDLPNHHALGAANINIVESLDLRAVSMGRYNLAALPLKIAGGDGSPIRAILWRE
ncbi:MAG: cyclase family protein [Verrucomicrobiota bacterium]|nr:cyclase family protein [Verrucomicrobiota bacterium]